MGRLNHHSKERIINMKEEGYKPSQILRILESEGVKISRVEITVYSDTPGAGYIKGV